MKKWLPLVLALVMVLVLFGCNKAPTTTDDTPTVTPPPVASNPNESTEEEPGEVTEPATSKWDTEVTVDYACFVNSGVDVNGADDAIAQLVHEKYNIIWEVIPLDWSNWTENFRIWVNAGDLPTQCFTDFAINDFRGYIEQGLIAQFPEGWQEKYPNLYTTWQINGISTFVDAMWGGTYAQVHAIYFEVPVFPYTASWTPMIRKDWVEKLGHEVKTVYSWTEMEDLFREILANYETLGLTKGTDYIWPQDFNNLFWSLDYSTGARVGIIWDEESQSYIYSLDKEEWLLKYAEKIDIVKRGLAEGWIHPDLFTFTANRECRDIFDAGNAFYQFEGSFAASVQGYWKNFREASGLEPADCLQLIITTDDEGIHHMNEALNYWACTVWNPTIDPDLFDRLLDLGNYRLSQEGRYTLTLGIEGVDWQMGANGKPENLRDTTAYPSLSDKYPAAAMYGSYFICSDDFGSYDPSLNPVMVAQCDQTWADKQIYGNDKNANVRYDYYYNLYNSDLKSKFNLDTNAMAAELISANKDTISTIKAFLEANRTLIDEVLADINANVTPQRLAAAQ